MPPVFKKAISWLGLVDDERPDETGQDVGEVPDAVEQGPDEVPASAPAFSGDDSRTVLLSPSLLVTPIGYHAVRPIADRYQAGLPTVMDLRVMPIDDAKRCVDFFSGMIFALDGSINRVAKGVFLLTPAGASVDQQALDALIAELR